MLYPDIHYNIESMETLFIDVQSLHTPVDKDELSNIVIYVAKTGYNKTSK